MRVAIAPFGEVGSRAIRVLLAESAVAEIGLHGRSAAGSSDHRLRPVVELESWNVLVTDAVEPLPSVLSQALDAGTSLVVWTDDHEALRAARLRADDYLRAGLTLLVGSNLRSGIGPSLVVHQTALVDEALESTLAWTTAGRPLHSGLEAIFPDPIGPRWAHETPLPAPVAGRLLAAPVEGPWSGVMARITAVLEEGVTVRTVGLADDDLHLQAIALASGALVLADGGMEPGLRWPSEAAHVFLDHAVRAGLEVATFSERAPDTPRT